MKTTLTRMLGIEYPIIQGGMAWVADHHIAAAVSQAGGLGLIAGANAPVDVVRGEIRKLKEMTGKPFGVNIMLMSPNATDLAQLVIDEKVPVVTTGAGNPGKFIPLWKEAGIKVIPVIPSVALAVRMVRSGADAVVAEGSESGGHIGELTTMALVPQVASAVDVPVIAAGGIADGRGLAAALMLGAMGAQLGTVFLAAEECNIHQNFKELVLKAKDTDTVVTGRINGHPARQLKNKFTKRIVEMEKVTEDPNEIENMLTGSLRMAAVEGDKDKGSFMCGQIAGLVKEIRPARVIIQSIVEEADDLIMNFSKRSGIELE